MTPRTRHRAYFVVMGLCVLLILLAWNLVRLWSVPAAVAMSVVAAVLPPVAAIVGNTGALRGSDLPSREDLDQPASRDADSSGRPGSDW